MSPSPFQAAVLITSFATLGACARATPPKMTVVEHRNEAAIHQARADDAREDQATNPAPPASRAAGPLVLGQSDGLFDGYDPSARSVAEADAEQRKANEHLAAASALVAFEAKACEGLSLAQRSACPLFASKVERVLPGPAGVLLRFKPSADVDETYRTLSCHHAWAVSTGFERPTCPMFIKGMQLARDGERGIAFLGENATVSAQLQSAARQMFIGTNALTRAAP